MIKTKAREIEGGAEDAVGGRCIPLGARVSALMVKNKPKKTSKQTTKSKTKQKQKTRNRKNRVLAAVISALEIGALTFKVNMDPNESFMRRLSC